MVYVNDGLAQMKPIKHALWMALLLSACGGNPFLPPGDGSGNGPPGTAGGIKGANDPIQRTEQVTASGNGYAVGIALNTGADPLDPADDTFEVDGLAFDGGNVYQPGATIGPFQIYEADSVYQDAVTGNNIDQDLYRAIYGASTTGKTSFAIVRTGSYIGYGFGGFVYKRTGGVTLPTSGFAGYTGEYAGLRDFNGVSGLEYTSGQMTLSIDFNDFNNGAGVKGSVTDRVIYDATGLDITADISAAIDAEYGTALGGAMPVLQFVVSNALKASGEATGTVLSKAGSDTLESGKYYALIANSPGLNAAEVVGVIVVESSDPRGGAFANVKTRETGGFIVYRSPEP